MSTRQSQTLSAKKSRVEMWGKMKKEYRKSGILSGILLLSVVLLTGCGSSTARYSENSTAEADKSMMKAGNSASYPASDDLYGTQAEAVTEESAAMGTAGETQTVNPVTEDRKLIKTVAMNVETEAYDELMDNVQKKITHMGGYVSNLSSGVDRYVDETRYATVVAKIPAEKVDQFVTEVSDISNVISKNETVDDVTLQYVDLESHKKALLTEQESLLKLMENATTMEDIISIESRLSEVRYQLESMESQLRIFDNQVAYSEISIYITEVTRLTPVEEVGTWEKISEGFTDNVERVGKGCKNFFIQLVINLPIIFVVAVLVLLVIFIVRFTENRCRLGRDKMLAGKKEKQMKEKASMQQSQQSTDTQSYGDYADQREKENSEK